MEESNREEKVMFGLRWKKIIGDLRSNKTRTVLVIAAMTVGVIGVSTVLCAYSILVRELAANYARTNPASAIITTDTVDISLIRKLEKFPGVGLAEARGVLPDPYYGT